MVPNWRRRRESAGPWPRRWRPPSTRCAPSTSSSSMPAMPRLAGSSMRSSRRKRPAACLASSSRWPQNIPGRTSGRSCSRRSMPRVPDDHFRFRFPLMSKTVRVAAGQGFWGDWLEAPVRQVRGGPIDYLMMDYLAEVTMSIMQKQKGRDPRTGYARDFPQVMERILPDLVERNIRVTSNAGGVNPRGCAEAVLEVARKLGLADKVRVGLVTGDDILERLDDLMARGHELRDMDTGRPLSDIRGQILSANAYIGMAPIVEALDRGATIVVTGRVTDTGLTLGPLVHEFGWPAEDWDRIAAGTVAGHIIECGAQASGGNLLRDWR